MTHAYPRVLSCVITSSICLGHSTWDGAFLTSTTRIVVPVTSVCLPQEGITLPSSFIPPLPAPLALPPSPLISKITQLVLEDMQTHCVDVMQ